MPLRDPYDELLFAAFDLVMCATFQAVPIIALKLTTMNKASFTLGIGQRLLTTATAIKLFLVSLIANVSIIGTVFYLKKWVIAPL